MSDLGGLSRKLVSHLSPMQHHAGQVVIRLMHDAHSEIHREVLAICRYKRDFGDSRMINSAMLLVNPHYLFCWDWHLTDTCCILAGEEVFRVAGMGSLSFVRGRGIVSKDRTRFRRT